MSASRNLVARPVLAERLRDLNTAPLRPAGDYVLYWMTSARRACSNLSLQRAVEGCRQLGRPLLVLEALRCGYAWASDRQHRLVLEGMRENAAAFARPGVTYLPYVEPEPGAGRGLLSALASRACVVVTDDWPSFFMPRMQAAAARQLDVRLVAVDGKVAAAVARATLEKHAADPRPQAYGREQLAAAATHDELWNAAQRQLVREGRLHNYLRMLWGKKVLQWSASPRAALDVLLELNHRYAVDGRDPNSLTGIFWCLGLYDRPWAPERPIFGTIRYMSSENTARKLRVTEYLQRHGP